VHEQLLAQAFPLATRAARARSAAAVALGTITPADRDDLEQEALLAVWRALNRFDPSRASLRTFIERVVAFRLASLVRTARLHPIAEPIKEGHLIGLDGIPALQIRMDLQQVATSLRAADRQLAMLLMDRTPTEASRELGVSRSTVYERIRRIRSAFEDAGWGPRGRISR
jgi:RNA polymerase sigma-70 factor, ECF subfamily